MFGWLCGRYPGLIGNLWGPGRSVTVWPFAPYALDNGAYVAYAHQVEWDSAQWLKLLASVQRAPHPPLWAVVPDVVGNRERTLESWQRYYPIVRDAGLTPAFAVQDGMEAADIPSEAEVIFVGGTTQWKWSTMEQWCQQFPRVHVGRVNGYQKLLRCYRAGAESTDGTGWFRGRHRQLQGLIDFCEFATGRRVHPEQQTLFSSGVRQDFADRLERQVGQLAYQRPRSTRSNRQQVAQLEATLF
jgi:hypothetical protein